jgi:hypothetical protein
MPYALEIKDANRNCAIYHRSRVYCTFTVSEGGLPILWLLEEAKHLGLQVLNAKPKIHGKVFEAGAIEIANVPKMRSKTKHLDIKYHHFRGEKYFCIAEHACTKPKNLLFHVPESQEPKKGFLVLLRLYKIPSLQRT